MKNKDNLIIGLLFILLILFGALTTNSYHLYKLKKDLEDTVEVVYWLNDKLLIAEDNIYYLNKEIDSNYKELEEKKQLERLIKDLR